MLLWKDILNWVSGSKVSGEENVFQSQTARLYASYFSGPASVSLFLKWGLIILYRVVERIGELVHVKCLQRDPSQTNSTKMLAVIIMYVGVITTLPMECLNITGHWVRYFTYIQLHILTTTFQEKYYAYFIDETEVQRLIWQGHITGICHCHDSSSDLFESKAWHLSAKP